MKPYKGLISLEYQLWDASIISRRHDAELTMCILMNIVKRAYENQWAPVAVHFTHEKPDSGYLHSKVFHSDIEFNKDCHSIILRASDLDKPMPGYDPHLNSILVRTIRIIINFSCNRVTSQRLVLQEEPILLKRHRLQQRLNLRL